MVAASHQRVQPAVEDPATCSFSAQQTDHLGSAVNARSSAPRCAAAVSVASTKIQGINVVVDTQKFSSPTVVTRQFSGISITPVKDLQGSTMKNPMAFDVASFGGIAPPALSVQASDMIRAQPNADATQMERAMQNISHIHDLISTGNDKHKPSLASLSDEDILVKASRLGISLGKNSNEVLKAVQSIKEVDVKQSLVILKKNVDAQLHKEEGQNSMLISKFSSLTGDLIIDEAQENLEHDDLLMPIINLRKVRKKKEFDLSGVRRSTRYKNKCIG
jgi:hypothetical protein